MTARLRDKLWEKAVAGSREGACLQAWSSPGEQGFVVRTHGDGSRKMVDFEGLHLVSIPHAND
jgi:CRISPR-associated protein Cas2